MERLKEGKEAKWILFNKASCVDQSQRLSGKRGFFSFLSYQDAKILETEIQDEIEELEKIHALKNEHDKRIYQKKLTEWQKTHEYLEKVRDQKRNEYIENAKTKYFLTHNQEYEDQHELPINMVEWKDDVYENPPPQEPETKEFQKNAARKEIEKVAFLLVLI